LWTFSEIYQWTWVYGHLETKLHSLSSLRYRLDNIQEALHIVWLTKFNQNLLNIFEKKVQVVAIRPSHRDLISYASKRKARNVKHVNLKRLQIISSAVIRVSRWYLLCVCCQSYTEWWKNEYTLLFGRVS
jgi:hypothetical protein